MSDSDVIVFRLVALPCTITSCAETGVYTPVIVVDGPVGDGGKPKECEFVLHTISVCEEHKLIPLEGYMTVKLWEWIKDQLWDLHRFIPNYATCRIVFERDGQRIP